MRLTVIGSGPGGYVAALKAAQLGARVTVIERDRIGGTCLNWGCIPTKTLVASAELLHKSRHLSEYGLELTGTVKPNLSRILDRKNKVVATLAKGIRSLFKSWNVEFLEGTAALDGPRRVAVRQADGTDVVLDTDTTVIATGSRPAEIPPFTFDGTRIISSTHALDMTHLPASIVIVGAGVIGCEFAFIFRELGAEVTMIEVLPRAVSTEDIEVSEVLERELKKRKISLLTNVRAVSTETTDDGVTVILEDGRRLSAEIVLLSVGRSFNTEGLGLEAAGIRTGTRGEITVNSRMETNMPGVYAVGDVTGTVLLAHVASSQGIVAACNACGISRQMDYSVVPAAIFTSPEIGSVGLREHQAAEKGIRTRIGRFPFRGLGKAHAMGEIAGMTKIIADAETDRLLGMHIIGPHASDLVHEGALALRSGLTVRDLGDMIHAHPTLSECLMEAAEDAHGEAIHALRK